MQTRIPRGVPIPAEVHERYSPELKEAWIVFNSWLRTAKTDEDGLVSASSMPENVKETMELILKTSIPGHATAIGADSCYMVTAMSRMKKIHEEIVDELEVEDPMLGKSFVMLSNLGVCWKEPDGGWRNRKVGYFGSASVNGVRCVEIVKSRRQVMLICFGILLRNGVSMDDCFLPVWREVVQNMTLFFEGIEEEYFSDLDFIFQIEVDRTFELIAMYAIVDADKQRHHDYFVGLYMDNVLFSLESQRHYDLAMSRETSGEVEPVSDTQLDI